MMKQNIEQSIHLSVETGYLIEGLALRDAPTAHQIKIVAGADRRDAQLLVDPNACGLDSFGDPTFCTRIAVASYPATLELVEESDGRRLFAVKAERYTGPALRLAVLPDPDQRDGFLARLLVLKEDSSIERIINVVPSS